MTQPTKASGRKFDSTTVTVDTRYLRGNVYNKTPCVNVKVRVGFEVITPEQWAELRNVAREQNPTIPDDSLAGLDAKWCQEHPTDYWWDNACVMAFERAEQDCKALFGEHVECFQDGRNGGWLVVKGLPDVEEWSGPTTCPDCTVFDDGASECSNCGEQASPWSGPSLKGSNVEGALFDDGTTLSDSANIYERWAFFVETCAASVADVPYQCAWMLAANVFAKEEGTREVEFLRAWKASAPPASPMYQVNQWDTETLAVPLKVKSIEDLIAYYHAGAGRIGSDRLSGVACVAVFNDPKVD